jgi:hypothetical protein
MPTPQREPENSLNIPVDDGEAAERIESLAGEVRINLIRLVALLVFYGQHLVNVYVFHDQDAANPAFHATATALVVAWGVAVIVLQVLLSRRLWLPNLKYVSSLWDAAMITALVVAAGGPRSPLCVLYFLVIAAVPVRLSLRLAYVATVACMSGYLLVLGYYVYVLVGYDKYYSSPEVRIPRSAEIIFLLALATAGFLAAQAVRQSRRLVRGNPVTITETPEA